MKRTLSIFLILIIALSTFKHATIYLFFKVNQDYIAENLCVEKDLEESTCNGCCQLEKKQDEQQEAETKNIPSQKETFQIDFFYTSTHSIAGFQKTFPKSIITTTSLYQSLLLQGLFRPPQIMELHII